MATAGMNTFRCQIDQTPQPAQWFDQRHKCSKWNGLCGCPKAHPKAHKAHCYYASLSPVFKDRGTPMANAIEEAVNALLARNDQRLICSKHHELCGCPKAPRCDAIEDGGIKYADMIKAAFGGRVLALVEGCTDGVPDAQGRKADWYERKRNSLLHLSQAHDDVLLVSGADKLHNARAIVADLNSIGEIVFERFSAKKDGTI